MAIPMLKIISPENGFGMGTQIIDPETGANLNKYVRDIDIHIPVDGMVTATFEAFVAVEVTVNEGQSDLRGTEMVRHEADALPLSSDAQVACTVCHREALWKRCGDVSLRTVIVDGVPQN